VQSPLASHFWFIKSLSRVQQRVPIQHREWRSKNMKASGGERRCEWPDLFLFFSNLFFLFSKGVGRRELCSKIISPHFFLLVFFDSLSGRRRA